MRVFLMEGHSRQNTQHAQRPEQLRGVISLTLVTAQRGRKEVGKQD